MWGVTTHVSALKISTDWTTASKKNMDTRGGAPSLMRILVNLCHTSRVFARFLTTSSQPSSAADITHPNYLKEVTISREIPYALKALDVIAFSSSAARFCRFRSAPFLHFAVRRFIPFKDLHGTSMSQRGHSGWRRFPSSSVTMVSRTCRCQKCTRMAVSVAARPLHPSTGQVPSPAFSGNAIRNILGSLPPPPLLSFFPIPPLTTLCWFWRCAASDPLSKYFLNSGHCNHFYCLSWYLRPSPVIQRL